MWFYEPCSHSISAERTHLHKTTDDYQNKHHAGVIVFMAALERYYVNQTDTRLVFHYIHLGN